MGAAGGRNNTVQPQIEQHLAVVVGGMPDHHGGQSESRVRAGIGALDGLEHVFRVDGAQRFADCGERIAQVGQQFFLGLRRAGTAFVAGLGWLLTVKFRSETEIRAGHMLYLFGKGANFGRAELRFLILELAFGGSITVFLLGHGFGGGTDFVFLVVQTAQKRGRDGFFLAHFGGGGFPRWRSLLSTLGFRKIPGERKRGKKGSGQQRAWEAQNGSRGWHPISPSGRVYHSRIWKITIWEVIENAEVKKSLRKAKILLDNNSDCDTLVSVESCVPTQSGRFVFGARETLSS